MRTRSKFLLDFLGTAAVSLMLNTAVLSQNSWAGPECVFHRWILFEINVWAIGNCPASAIHPHFRHFVP